jgi:hypothetical protein
LEEAIRKQLSKYNKKELYQWLIVSMIHPSNQKFGIRYELLIHTLLSIKEDKFLNEELTKEKFEEFISWFEKEYWNTTHFMMMEDFEPFNQIKLIPLLLDGEKYYFFYSSLERPYESLKQFHDILFSVEITELESIKYEFLSSLQRQTDILTKLANDKESKYETTDMYIPSLKFFNKYKSFFEVQNIDKNYLHNSQKIPPLTEIEKMYDFGFDKEIDTVDIPQLDIDLDDSLYSYEMGMNNFNGLYTHIHNEYFYLPFETHTETFYTIAGHIIYNSQFQVFSTLNKSMHQRMMKLLSYFFSPPHRIDGLIDKSKNIHSKYFDTLVTVDNNKVILFKFIPHSNDLHDSITNIIEKVFNELKTIQSVDELFTFKYADESMIHMNKMPINIFETKIIIIFEKLTINYMLHFKEEWKEKNIFIYNSLDIKPILELFSEKKSDTNIALWQYLEAEKRQASHNNNPIQMDVLDSFTNYYKNETFAIMGQQPDMMMFSTHSWSDFYHEYLYKKYQDNIYELVELNFPNRFNRITHLGNSTYEYIDTSIFDGGKCVKYNNRLIWISYPNGFNLKDEELKVSMFLVAFFSFYIDRYKESIFQFLKVFTFDINTQDLMMVVFPDTVVKQNKDMEHLLPYANKINDNEPVIFNSYIRKVIYNEIFVGVFCSSSLEKLENTFGYNNNFNPEKYIFEKFITSLLQALNIQRPKELVPKFIENIWDLEERAFIIKSGQTNNPRLSSYQKPLTIQPSFIANVNQEMVNYLKEIKVEIKEHWEGDAKKLNNQIFESLQQKLEETISQFDNSILIYAYKQIEYIEGKRESDKNQMEFDVQKYIAFDIHERHNEERLEVSELAVSAKHILHSILKVNPQGHKNIVDSDWYYLMAFSKIINETIQRSDQLHYRLAKTGIEITNLYELIDIDESSEIDSNKYYQETTNSNIVSAKNKPLESNQPKQNESSKDVLLFDNNLNSAWTQEFEFSLENMVKIIVILGRHIVKKDDYFPLIALSIEEIAKLLDETLLEIGYEEIEKIIFFLSLDFNTYSDYKYIDYSLDRLMKRKERINLSPFIKIDDKYLFGQQLLLASFTSWYSTLIEGDIPFSIDENSLVKEELKRIHRKLDLELEKKSYEITKNILGKEFVRETIRNFKQLSKTFQKQPPCGEIDLLIANPKIKTLFVLDAKNINKKFFTSAIKRELRDFFEGRNKKKSYLAKLNMKVVFIKENQDEILNHFKIIDKNGWKIKKGFVVNTLYVSAFYKEKVDFVLIDDLEEYIQG